jgi:hypothetical protein
MSPAKKKSAPVSASSFSKLRSLLTGWSKTLVIGAILVGILVIAGFAIGKFVREKVLSNDEYRLTAEKIQISPWPPPAYVKPDPRREVFDHLQQQNQLQHQGSISIMEENLAERITAAFEQNPWIAKVRGPIFKEYPATIKVEVEYRVPVMMVEVAGNVYAVDAKGISLPTRDCFTTPEMAAYPRLIGVDMPPTAAVGTRWGDSRVLGAAEIAATLLPNWQKLHLKRIVPLPISTPKPGVAAGSMQSPCFAEYQFELIARGIEGEKHILWGKSPFDKNSSDFSPAEKAKKLEDLSKEFGSLEKCREEIIDLNR